MGDATGSASAFFVFVMEIGFLAAYGIIVLARRRGYAARFVTTKYAAAEWACALLVVGFTVAASLAAGSAADLDGRKMNEEQQVALARNLAISALPSGFEGLRKEMRAMRALGVCPGPADAVGTGHR